MSIDPDQPLSALLDALVERLATRVADLIVERLRVTPPEGEAGPALVTKRAAAASLSVSSATIDRWVRAGAPVHPVGAHRRFDVAELRTWLAERGQRAVPTNPGAMVPLDDVLEVAASAGLRPTSGKS